MTTDDDRDVAAWLDGIDGPRPVPGDLDRELVGLLGAGDPVAALAGTSPDRAVGVPVDLRDRLEATLAGAAPDSAVGTVLPIDVRRRLTRALAPGALAGTRVLRIAAVIVAVMFVAGGLAFAIQDRDEVPSTDLAVEPEGDDHGDGRGFDQLPDVDPSEVGDDTAETPGAVVDAGPGTPTTIAPAAKPRVRRQPAPVPPPKGDGVLVAYASCDDLLGRTKASALEAVGPYGLNSGPVSAGPDEATADGRAGAAAPSAAAASESADTPGDAAAATTNLQEEGVDEPDIDKSDGRRFVTQTDQKLRVSKDDAGRLVVLGSLSIPDGASATSLLVDGDRALVLGSTWSYAPPPSAAPARSDASAGFSMPVRQQPQAVIWTIDLRDPGALKIETTLLLDGTVGAARLVDRRVRIALTSTAVGPDWVYPSDGSEAARQRALEENRRLVRESTVEDWLPSYTLLRGTDASTARRGRICACDDTLRPQESFAGAATMSVLTLDPQRPDDPPAGSNAVQGWAETVYASKSNLFVTTRSFKTRFQAGAPTAIHRFDITNPDTATYRGSGEVRGFPLNQFSLSERAGHLRVATTDAVDGTSTESFVSVLAVRDDQLEPVGQVGNLGKGERIFTVRFLDTVGYVVTFRQTDPLYTVDLSEPAKPVVRGELKIPGFSAYLHPVDDGRLLGVGQDANETGRTTGAQISSFDVGNIDQPREVSKIGFGTGSSSEVQQDHHAFLYWAPARKAMLPLQRFENDGGTYRTSTWLSVVAVGGEGTLSEVGRITHDGRPARNGTAGARPIRRSFVVGDVLYTLSADGILASDLTSLADRSWLAF
jgi:hypothetical protein